MINNQIKTDRRDFLNAFAASAAAIGMGTLGLPGSAQAGGSTPLFGNNAEDPETFFKSITGKHRIVFDVPKPHEIFPFAWPRVFQMTNNATGTSDKDLGIVVVLRHSAIGYAMKDELWAKYKFGELFDVKEGATATPAVRNAFYNPKQGEMPMPGMSINELMASGVKFAVCDMALTVYSMITAQKIGGDKDAIRKEWVAGLLPGMQQVPSGVWAVGRAQENGCAYCFAG